MFLVILFLKPLAERLNYVIVKKVNRSTSIIYMFTHFAAGKVRRGQTMPENDALVQVVKMHPEILQQMLSTVLNIIMFEDCRNQWSMSRPLLGLILLNEDYFQSLRDQVFAHQNSCLALLFFTFEMCDTFYHWENPIQNC